MNALPGKLPPSSCSSIISYQDCVNSFGCGWLRTIKNNGICRDDPVTRCISSGDCKCAASDFHGPSGTFDSTSLEIFLPLSITPANLAPRTRSLYIIKSNQLPVAHETLRNFTSRTDFTHRTLTVLVSKFSDLYSLKSLDCLTIAFKFMPVWGIDATAMTGSMISIFGINIRILNDQVNVFLSGRDAISVEGENPVTKLVKQYQCNQLVLRVPNDGSDATVLLGRVSSSIPGLSIDYIQAYLNNNFDAFSTPEPIEILKIGPVKAKVWDFRLYANEYLNDSTIISIGKRCGVAGDYHIPLEYPNSNRRYSYGMGGYDIVKDHFTASYSSGVYSTSWIPSTGFLFFFQYNQQKLHNS
jgi:hypothetical protein